MWIYLAIGAGVVVGVWILSRRPVKREVTTGDFRHFFQEMLIGSRRGAWIEIRDPRTESTLAARKLDDFGQRMYLELHLPVDVDTERMMQTVQDLAAGSLISSVAGVDERNCLALEIDLVGEKSVDITTSIALSFFEVAGVVPGSRFELQGQGHPDIEAFRPLFQALRRNPKGTRSKRWGVAFENHLDRRRRR